MTLTTAREQMIELIERHLAAEEAGDVDGAIAVYTDDVQHDVVGWPTGLTVTHEYYGDDFCVLEHQRSGTVPGVFMGVPGHGKAVNFRMLHVFEYRDGLISRENVWLDGGALMAQLNA